MIFKSIFSDLLLETVLILISAYVVVKAHKTRKVNAAAKAYFYFAVLNLFFVICYLLSGLHKLDLCLPGVTAGYVISLLLLITLAVSSSSWFVYIEKTLRKKWIDTNRKTLLWSLPVLVYIVLCIVSCWTGWIFTVDGNGAYAVGSLYFIQYVVCFGYCVIAMVSSARNYFTVKDKSRTDRVLFLTMVVDLVAVILQLCLWVNLMPVALTLTLLLSYLNIFTAEVQEFEKEQALALVAQREKDAEHAALAENYTRFFALEDDFESLYDVELESGHYVSYDRDEFYKRNVSDLVVSATEFFEDLRTNVERVVYEEDREAVYNVQTRQAIIQGLAEKDHIDHYYRIVTENGPMWLRMRIVYKDKNKKNVIVGIFNAEEEMAAKQKEEQFKEELVQNNARLFALEDNFESLYDVELESGHYDVFVKGDFFRNNVVNKLAVPADYFEQLHENIDAVIYEEDRDGLYNTLTREAVCRELAEDEHFDHYYRIITEDGPIWFKMRIVYKNSDRKNIIIGVFNAAEEMAAKEKEAEQNRNTEMQLRHEQLRVEVLNYMIDHDDDPIELLKNFAERLRVLINCDQVIYRDLEETRIMVNSPAIEETWSVPMEFCLQCEHFDAHHPMYADGYTEMDNCQEGWQGIPVYHECPIKSSLTRIVSCDGAVAGYLAVHFVQNYHRFTDVERATLEEFARILSISLSRFEAKKENRELKLLQEMQAQLEKDMQMIGGLASGYDALYYVNIDEGFYSIYALDEKKYPGAQGAFLEEPDFYGVIRRYGSSDFIHPEDRHLFNGFSAEAIRKKLSGKKQYSIRFRVDTGNGYRWDEMDVVKYEDAYAPANAVAVGFADRDADIRKQQELLQQLEDARETADAANRSKSNFLFNMSHDIRTPMNAIRGFTSMAKKNVNDGEKVSEYLDKIDISGQQLLTLINQVLEMARIESGKMELEEKPVNVQKEFDAMVTVLTEQANANGLDFRYSINGLEHNNVLTDEAKMSSVTLNIAGNAMKYTPQGGSIEFSLTEVPGRRPGFATFVFTVADTGIGMSEEFLQKLYEPFSRESSSTVSKIQGTGLGLSIVKSTIELMGGNIEVRSALGKGTRFDITVDFRIDTAAHDAEEESKSVRTLSFRGRRVLLVEDNDMNREIARDLLEDEGLTVEEAEDGDVAVAMVQAAAARGESRYYDFILMDIQMPRMNGFEATRAIRAMLPETDRLPIIALSANAFAEDRTASIAAGMDDHVAKPIDVRELFHTLAKYL